LYALVQRFMSRPPIAYIPFVAGAMVTIGMLGAPALIFALGMHLPLELNRAFRDPQVRAGGRLAGTADDICVYFRIDSTRRVAEE
jgi:hypothetical protein